MQKTHIVDIFQMVLFQRKILISVSPFLLKLAYLTLLFIFQLASERINLCYANFAHDDTREKDIELFDSRGDVEHRDAIACQMLSWRMKNRPHFLNI